jgi:hypothetical protein
MQLVGGLNAVLEYLYDVLVCNMPSGSVWEFKGADIFSQS